MLTEGQARREAGQGILQALTADTHTQLRPDADLRRASFTARTVDAGLGCAHV